jgi:two-component system CheB/CheR fusion protein
MKNLLESTGMGVIFLDTNLAVKQFTREATIISHLIATDIGRPLNDIKLSILGEDLVSEALAVLETLIPREKVVETSGHAWYMVRILPYRTLENVIDGVVLTFIDITERKKIEDTVNDMRSYAENIVDTVREPLIVLDGGLKVISASASFYKAFHVDPQDSVGKYIYEVGNRQWDIPRLRELLETILPHGTSFENFEVEHEFSEIGHKKMLLNARRIVGNAGETRFILLAMEEITNRSDAPKG